MIAPCDRVTVGQRGIYAVIGGIFSLRLVLIALALIWSGFFPSSVLMFALVRNQHIE